MEAISTVNTSTDNKILKEFITTTTESLNDVKDIHEVESLLDKVIAHPFKLKFDNLKLWLLSTFFVLLGAAYIYFIATTRNYDMSWIDLGSFLILIVGVVWPLKIVGKRAQSIQNLNNLFIVKTRDLLYRITLSSQHFRETINNKFVDFNRGNYSQNVSWCKELEFNYNDKKMKVDALQHHYVVERIVEEKVRNGRGGYKTVRRKVYDHYYREGIVFPPIAEFKSLVISNDSLHKKYSESFKPTSIVFDEHFYVMAESEFSAAKFLGPSVVLAFEDLNKKFKGLTFEIAPDGSILINQKQTGLLNTNISTSINTPVEFKQDLLKNLTLDNVNIMFAFMNNLIKYLGK
ncbi:hypothetical protein [Aliiglaciecola litoralis]|uniref:DUF3137 domain-containing protein n=1 Tax=Aliiglaciecola litoralis TaxID=582857 RepID=A0ABN1LPR1_9ALTE